MSSPGNLTIFVSSNFGLENSLSPIVLFIDSEKIGIKIIQSLSLLGKANGVGGFERLELLGQTLYQLSLLTWVKSYGFLLGIMCF